MMKNQSVFSTKLSRTRVFNCKPVKIHLKKNPKLPTPCNKARTVPAHWMKKGQEIISDLLEEELTKRTEGPTPVCSPSFHVRKPRNRLEPRLVIDYLPVNDKIERPLYPSSSPEQCWNKVAVGSKYFISVDMSAAYL
jgi:hypothetical protein